MSQQDAPSDLAELTAAATAAHDAYIAHRERIDAGDEEWMSLSQFFTEDAIYVDPAWGRVEGHIKIAEFMRDSMQGLEAWKFPHDWTMVEGNRVVSSFHQLIPNDGAELRQYGISVMYHAGDGKFAYQMDLMNMAHIMEDIKRSSNPFGGDINIPPRVPNRDYSLGAAEALELSSRPQP